MEKINKEIPKKRVYYQYEIEMAAQFIAATMANANKSVTLRLSEEYREDLIEKAFKWVDSISEKVEVIPNTNIPRHSPHQFPDYSED